METITQVDGKTLHYAIDYGGGLVITGSTCGDGHEVSSPCGFIFVTDDKSELSSFLDDSEGSTSEA